MTTQIKFRPWTGANYENGFQGLRTFILGESQYTCQPCENPSLFTIERVKDTINGWKHPFWTKTATALLGNDPTLKEKGVFWNSVAIYDYVQEFAGSGPRIEPSPKCWESSESAFVEVLEELKPEFMLVLGYRLWYKMPCLNARRGPIIEGARIPETWLYPHSAGDALTYCVKHPSSGFSALTEHQYILVAMNNARKLNQGSG